MRDLRLIGVDEGGQHLVFAGPDDERFRVHLDDALRAAARRDRPRLGQLQIEIDGGLTPRDVQMLVRGGATAEDVAERAGWSVDKVRRYEAPILAERAHVADLAQKVGMPGRGGSGVISLSTRVAERLRERGVDPQSARWDATRAPDSSWVAIVAFEAGGRVREARWAFDLANRTVVATDDEARWLGEEASAEGPLPSPHLVSSDATTAHVYDVEAEGGIHAARRREASGAEPVDLMSAMRARTGARGRRSGRRRDAATHVSDRTPDDALPLAPLQGDPELMQAPPAARGTHPQDLTEIEGEGAADVVGTTGTGDGATAVLDAEPGQVESTGSGSDGVGSAPADPDDAGSATADLSRSPVPEADPAPDGDAPTEAPATAAATGKHREPGARRRSGRRSVPSWDDVMFGAKD